MKKYHIIKHVSLLVLCCFMFGCGKARQGSIYGTVTDYVTGDPVANANVRLNPRGETALTGYDGTFQFYDLANGNYYLSISKNGYADLDDDYIIRIESGNSVRRDVQLNPGVESFKISVNGVETDTMYFGIYPNAYGTFLITNNGTVPVEVSGSTSDRDIVLFNTNSTIEWHSIVLQPNQGYSVRVFYDSLYSLGYIYVNSSQVSKTIVCILNE
ncbi:MAG: carboxypeptidase-like regulatory domain-containing protein [Bacteroidales bacterium]|nr:carboxypeptidase-like regulatory domain-containing protein [Bacteroidales bacterium]